VIQFIQETKIATRQWHLSRLIDESADKSADKSADESVDESRQEDGQEQ
jgi:hypothetical protein